MAQNRNWAQIRLLLLLSEFEQAPALCGTDQLVPVRWFELFTEKLRHENPFNIIFIYIATILTILPGT